MKKLFWASVVAGQRMRPQQIAGKPNLPGDGDGEPGTGRRTMRTMLKSLSSVVAACALLVLGSVNAYSHTTCDLVLELAALATPGEVVDHKTDFYDGDCTTQVALKVDKSNPDVTKVDFKIDRSCYSTGQAQFTGISLEITGSSPVTSCNVDYDNPADQTEAGEDTLIADVPGLAELILDAANATALQFPSGNPTADAVVSKLNDAGVCTTPPCGGPGGGTGGF